MNILMHQILKNMKQNVDQQFKLRKKIFYIFKLLF